VHTTRYHYGVANAGGDSQGEKPVAEINAKSKANAEANNTPKKLRRPRPYSWEQAVGYAEMYPEDITPHKIGGYKDKYGNFSKWRCIDFLGDQGLCNRGDSFWGRPSHTFLRFTIHYGQETNEPTPFATIIWAADINRRHQNDLNSNYADMNINNNNYELKKISPKYLRIVFESGYEKEFPTDMENMRWLHYANFNIFDILTPWSRIFPWFFPTSIGYKRSGYIFLTYEDLWDIYKHGNIVNVYLDDGHGLGMGTGQLSFFYSGEKQEEHKRQLTYGIEHMIRLLNINPATVAYDRKQREDEERKAHYDKVREEVKNEIYKDEIRKEIMEEVRKEYREDKQMVAEWGGK